MILRNMHVTKIGEADKEKRDIFFWLKRVSFLTFHYIVWITVSFKNWGKRKTLPPVRNELLKKSATKLAEEIRLGKVKSIDVIQSYIDRILEVNPIINAIADDNFQGAFEEARTVDALIESGQYSVEELARDKPLLGVPFTVKILISVKGFRLTAGSLIFEDRIATEDAPSITLLKNAGAIFLAMTNTAEFGSCIESSNYVHGRTNNPYDTTRTPGGSSGGEGAILGAAGSVIGLGNDFLGSVRIPTNFCSLFAHKATVGWISNKGCVPSLHPSHSHMLYVGPMCRYAEDLATLTSILSPEKRENFLKSKTVTFKKLKIYYQTEIKHVCLLAVDKDIKHGILEAVSHFKKTYGSEVREVDISLLKQASRAAISTSQAHLPNPIALVTDGRVKSLNGFTEIIKWAFGISKFTFMVIMSQCLGKNPLFFKQKHVPYYEDVNKRIAETFDSLLDENSIFVLPTTYCTAPYHFESHFALPNTTYTSSFNCTGFPVTQCPLGINKKGMPFGFQIVSKRDNDALSIACAVELEKVFGGWISPEEAFKCTT